MFMPGRSCCCCLVAVVIRLCVLFCVAPPSCVLLCFDDVLFLLYCVVFVVDIGVGVSVGVVVVVAALVVVGKEVRTFHKVDIAIIEHQTQKTKPNTKKTTQTCNKMTTDNNISYYNKIGTKNNDTRQNETTCNYSD